MVLPNKRKIFAKSVLALYAFITVTFPLAHKDFIPLESKVVLNPTDCLPHVEDSSANELVCPAHNFAQSTTSTPASSQGFASQISVFFLQLAEQTEHFIEPTQNYSTRAPPLA